MEKEYFQERLKVASVLYAALADRFLDDSGCRIKKAGTVDRDNEVKRYARIAVACATELIEANINAGIPLERLTLMHRAKKKKGGVIS